MPRKLLLADDSITIQKVVGITFAQEDYDITYVDNGADAIKKAAEIRPDIILADIVMPKKNGYEVCETVKKDPNLKAVPVLLLAGTFETFDVNRGKLAGADDYIIKPFESQTLIDKVNSLIAKSKGGASAATSTPVIASPAPAATPVRPAPVPVTAAPTPVAPIKTAPPPPPPAPPAPPAAAEIEIDMPTQTGIEFSLDTGDLVEEPPAKPQIDSSFSFATNPMMSSADISPKTKISEAPTETGFDLNGAFDGSTGGQFGVDDALADNGEKLELSSAADMMMDLGSTSVESNENTAAAPQSDNEFGFSFDEPTVAAPQESTRAVPKAAALAPAAFDVGGSDFDPLDLPPLPQAAPPPPKPSPARPTPAPMVATPVASVAAPAPSIPTISEEEVREIITKTASQIIEKVAWDVIPDLAEKIIRAEIARLTAEIGAKIKTS